jgi:hypothetical protein
LIELDVGFGAPSEEAAHYHGSCLPDSAVEGLVISGNPRQRRDHHH